MKRCILFLAALSLSGQQVDLRTNVKGMPTGTQTQYFQIQPNTGSNKSFQFRSLIVANMLDYVFPTQTGLPVLAPGNNTITMRPVPLGVNGTNVNHRLYVSGTGTPESCLITGGTGVAGQISGQIIINCANAHTAGATIQSATGGLQEAIIANPWGRIQMPCSAFHIKAKTSFVKTIGNELFGCSPDQNNANGTVIINDDITSSVTTLEIPDHSTGGTYQQQIWLHDFKMTCNVLHTCGTHLNVISFLGLHMDRVWLERSGLHGMYCLKCNVAFVTQCAFFLNNYSGATFDQAANQVTVKESFFISNSAATGYGGLSFRDATSGSNPTSGAVIQGNDFETQDYGLLFSYVGGATVLGNRWETHSVASLYGAAGVSGIKFDGNYNLSGLVHFDTGTTNISIGCNTWDGSGGLTGLPTQITYNCRQNYGASAPYTGALYPLPSGTATASGGAATLDAQQGVITTESLTTASTNVYTLTLTNAVITTSSYVGAQVSLGSATQGSPQIRNVKPGAGSVIITVENAGALSFDGTLKVAFTVSNLN